MPQGDKSSYTSKQKRQATKIGRGYRKRGVSKKEAARRAWATVNAQDHGGKKSGSGRGRKPDRTPSRKGGRKSQTGRTQASRAAAGRKAARTRKRNASKRRSAAR